MKTRIALVTILAVATMGPQLARAMEPQNNTVPMLATQPGPLPTSQPVILGQVTDATAHSVTVATAKSENMTFELDSRTVAPGNLKSGDHVRIEFRLMDNGTHFAGRITPLMAGSAEDIRLQNQLAANNVTDTYPTSEIVASNESTEPAGTMTNNEAAEEAHENVGQNTSENNDQSMGERSDDEANSKPAASDELPRTGSNRNWLLIAGLGAFAAAFSQRLIRRSS